MSAAANNTPPAEALGTAASAGYADGLVDDKQGDKGAGGLAAESALAAQMTELNAVRHKLVLALLELIQRSTDLLAVARERNAIASERNELRRKAVQEQAARLGLEAQFVALDATAARQRCTISAQEQELKRRASCFVIDERRARALARVQQQVAAQNEAIDRLNATIERLTREARVANDNMLDAQQTCVAVDQERGALLALLFEAKARVCAEARLRLDLQAVVAWLCHRLVRCF